MRDHHHHMARHREVQCACQQKLVAHKTTTGLAFRAGQDELPSVVKLGVRNESTTPQHREAFKRDFRCESPDEWARHVGTVIDFGQDGSLPWFIGPLEIGAPLSEFVGLLVDQLSRSAHAKTFFSSVVGQGQNSGIGWLASFI